MYIYVTSDSQIILHIHIALNTRNQSLGTELEQIRLLLAHYAIADMFLPLLLMYFCVIIVELEK